jgi:hypothetical protein
MAERGDVLASPRERPDRRRPTLHLHREKSGPACALDSSRAGHCLPRSRESTRRRDECRPGLLGRRPRDRFHRRAARGDESFGDVSPIKFRDRTIGRWSPIASLSLLPATAAGPQRRRGSRWDFGGVRRVPVGAGPRAWRRKLTTPALTLRHVVGGDDARDRPATHRPVDRGLDSGLLKNALGRVRDALLVGPDADGGAED